VAADSSSQPDCVGVAELVLLPWTGADSLAVAIPALKKGDLPLFYS